MTLEEVSAALSHAGLETSNLIIGKVLLRNVFYSREWGECHVLNTNLKINSH